MIARLRPAARALPRRLGSGTPPRPAPQARLLSTAASSARAGHNVRWAIAAVASGSLLAYSIRPDLNPFVTACHADSPATYADPTTSTAFSTTLAAPSGVLLQLIGTGVRVVSFLSVRVYAAGFYLDQGALGKAQLIGFEPERLASPLKAEPREGVLVGEKLMADLLESTNAAVVIVPLRNTTLTHLRDAFSRALIGRLKIVGASIAPEQAEAASLALSDFKSLFPGRTLAKGVHLELFFDAKASTVKFQMKDPKKPGEVEVLGTLSDPILARELIVSYFNDNSPGSPELVQSVARGLAGEPRS